jgi:hypothetical protein
VLQFESAHQLSPIGVFLASSRAARANKPKALSALAKCRSEDVTDVGARRAQFCWQTKLFLAATKLDPFLQSSEIRCTRMRRAENESSRKKGDAPECYFPRFTAPQ